MPREPQPGDINDFNGVTDVQISSAVLAMVSQRGADSSACPSEVARSLSPNAWRPLMPRIRQVAVQLAQAGLVHISQGARVLNPAEPWRGPVRLRQPMHPPADSK